MNSHQIKLVNVKITKGQVDEAVAAGITHAKFKNKGVQKRLVKQQQKVQREQERREAHFKLVNKHKQRMIDQQRTVYTEAAQAEPVVQEGADALQALFGENQPQPADGVNAADLQSVTGLSELNPFDAPSGGHRQQMFVDVDSHAVLAESVQGGETELVTSAYGKVFKVGVNAGSDHRLMSPIEEAVRPLDVPPSVAVSFDAESKGLVIRPEDMQKAIDESIERVPAGGYRYGTDLAVIMADKPMITEDGLVIGGESMIRTPIEFGEPSAKDETFALKA